MMVLSPYVDNLKPRLSADICNELLDFFSVVTPQISIDLLTLIIVVLQVELTEFGGRKSVWKTMAQKDLN